MHSLTPSTFTLNVDHAVVGNYALVVALTLAVALASRRKPPAIRRRFCASAITAIGLWTVAYTPVVAPMQICVAVIVTSTIPIFGHECSRIGHDVVADGHVFRIVPACTYMCLLGLSAPFLVVAQRPALAFRNLVLVSMLTFGLNIIRVTLLVLGTLGGCPDQFCHTLPDAVLYTSVGATCLLSASNRLRRTFMPSDGGSRQELLSAERNQCSY